MVTEMIRGESFRKKVYKKQIHCSGCKEPLVAKVLLNSYTQYSDIKRPHFELVCQNCSYGNVFILEEDKKHGIHG